MSAESLTPLAVSGSPSIWTLGHSNHPLDHFLGLLAEHGIEVVADVRSRPYSRYAPHFSRDALQASVTSAGLRYLFLGKELGGRPADASFYDEGGHVRYDRLAETPRFRAGIARLLAAISRWRVALVCAEEDPRDCHRRLVVGRVLVERSIGLLHIRGDRTVVGDADLTVRAGVPAVQLGLFDEQREGAWRSIRSASRDARRRRSLGR